MQIEQAIFTSIRSRRNDGYQIAAASPGVTSEQKRELLHWCPAHDSLADQKSTSTNFHGLEDGSFCIVKTSQAGAEYSGRGGARIYSQCLLVSQRLMERFSNHPFRVLEAVQASGRVQLLDPIPKQLDAFRLVGRASPANTAMLAMLTRELGADRLAAMVSAAISTMQLAIVSPVPAERLFAATLDLLPPPCRTEFPFATGLRYSPRRPFRWLAISPESDKRIRLNRMNNISVLDLSAEVSTRYMPEYGWPLLIWDLLRKSRFTEITNVLKMAQRSRDENFDELAERLREQLLHGESLDQDVMRSPGKAADETGQTGNGSRGDRKMLPGGIER